jgi:hypothetical protein
LPFSPPSRARTWPCHSGPLPPPLSIALCPSWVADARGVGH